MEYTRRGSLKLKIKKDAKPSGDSKKQKKEKKRESRQLAFKLADGRIVSNETTVQGFETRFMEEIAVGDTVGVNHPTSLNFEERTVTTLLSQRSLIIDMAFSTNLISTCAFFVRPDGKALLEELEKDNKEPDKPLAARLEETLNENMVRKHSTALRVRERKGIWGYKTSVEQLDEELTAEQLLDMRIKRTGRDKYC